MVRQSDISSNLQESPKQYVRRTTRSSTSTRTMSNNQPGCSNAPEANHLPSELEGNRGIQLGWKSPINDQTIMAATLRIKGKACTATSLRSRYGFLRSKMSDKHFLSIANKLEQAKLGRVLEVMMSNGQSRHVFLKKPPDVIREALEAREDLCSVEYFTQMYHSQSYDYRHLTRVLMDAIEQATRDDQE